MKWMIDWKILSDQQRKIITDIESSSAHCLWVNGFSGTGKTFVLIFIIKRFLKFSNGTACFVTFTNALRDLVEQSFKDTEKNRVKILNLYQFKLENNTYDIIALDEVQDATFMEVNLANKRAKKKLIIGGDLDQRIYENKISNDELLGLVEGHQFYLQKIYRLTEKVKRIAHSVYPNSKLLAADYPTNIMSLKKGSDVYLFKAQSEEDEVRNVIDIARNKYSPSYPCAILLPSHRVIKRFCNICAIVDGRELDISYEENINLYYSNFNRISMDTGWDIQYFGNGFGSIVDSDIKSKIYIMTYHSAKGLDFNTVFLPFLDKYILDAVLFTYAKKEPDMDKRLLYVTLTRTRFDLILSYHSQLSGILNGIKNNKLVREMSFALNCSHDNEETDDDLF